MDSDGFTTFHGRQRTKNEPVYDRTRADFRRDVPKYVGTSEEYDQAHHHRYGREEGMRGVGNHAPGKYAFPPGSDRQRRHESYSISTKPAQRAWDNYENAIGDAHQERDGMGREQRDHYTDSTGGFPPDRHERLFGAAKKLAELNYKSATGRDDFLQEHPQGYHSKDDAEKHHKLADQAYGRYEYADAQQRLHSRHRSYRGTDSGRDKWGRANPRDRH